MRRGAAAPRLPGRGPVHAEPQIGPRCSGLRPPGSSDRLTLLRTGGGGRKKVQTRLSSGAAADAFVTKRRRRAARPTNDMFGEKIRKDAGFLFPPLFLQKGWRDGGVINPECICLHAAVERHHLKRKGQKKRADGTFESVCVHLLFVLERLLTCCCRVSAACPLCHVFSHSSCVTP